MTPVINSISPARSLSGTSTQVTTSGRGFGANLIVVRRNGVTPLITNKSDTQLAVRLDIAANADTGNHNILFIANNQESNRVGFFVQVPTRILREAIKRIESSDEVVIITEATKIEVVTPAHEVFNSPPDYPVE